MNFYVEDIEPVVDLLKVLNEWEKHWPDAQIMLKQPVELISTHDAESVLGELHDVIGGVWSWEPRSGEA